MIDKELLEQFQMMMAAIESLERTVAGTNLRMEKVEMRMEKLEESLTGTNAQMKNIKDSLTHTNILIECDVARRIDILFDGYKLNSENQSGLQSKVENHDARIERLETKTA